MAISYNKLWKTLIDKKLKKIDLINEVGISSSTLAKLSKDEMVSMSVLDKICSKLECDYSDIIEHVEEE